VFPTQIEEQILRVPGLSPHYLCVLTRPGRMDELTVRVEAQADETATDERQRLGQALAERIKQAVGVSVAVEVVGAYDLARSLGKAKRIDDQR
jgi:phenylacetate-CoA ligase